jgi:hypothetical protein
MRLWPWIILFALSGTGPAWASLSGIEVDIQELAYPGIELRGLRLNLQPSRRGISVTVAAESLDAPEPIGVLRDIRLFCPRLVSRGDDVWCGESTLDARSDHGRVRLERVQFGWNRETRALQFGFEWLGWLGERGRYAGYARGEELGVDFVARGIQVSQLPERFALRWFDELKPEQGVLDLRGRLVARGRALQGGIDWELRDLAFSDAQGLRAAEGLDIAGQLEWSGRQFRLQARSQRGAVYWDPIYWDPAEYGALALDVLAESIPEAPVTRGWAIQEATLALEVPDPDGEEWPTLCNPNGGVPAPAILQLTSGVLDASGFSAGSLRWNIPQLGRLSDWLIQPLSAARMYPGFQLRGCSRGGLKLFNGDPQALTVQVQQFEAKHGLGRWRLEVPSGSTAWDRYSVAPASQIEISGGEVFRLPFGAFAADWVMEPSRLRLLHPVWIPMFGGGPGLDSLEVDFSSPIPAITAAGGIRAMSLEELTRALGLPVLAGQLAAIVPQVALTEEGLRVEGNILLRVFDGEVIVRNLRIRDLFRAVPVLEASATLRHLDLELLTSALDFGRIEGRLKGDVRDLVLVDWRPERMDLSLTTPETDPGRRRISQRAIDTLAAVGGGAGATPSLFLLRLFEDFSYRRLGFSCELRGEVCLASGVRDGPDDSFFLVEGGGLPRIDIVGHNRRVDWPELLRRLQAVR